MQEGGFLYIKKGTDGPINRLLCGFGALVPWGPVFSKLCKMSWEQNVLQNLEKARIFLRKMSHSPLKGWLDIKVLPFSRVPMFF